MGTAQSDDLRLIALFTIHNLGAVGGVACLELIRARLVAVGVCGGVLIDHLPFAICLVGACTLARATI